MNTIFLEEHLEGIFKDSPKESLDLAKCCINYIRNNRESGIIYYDGLITNVVSEQLEEEGYTMGGSDYREREIELVDLCHDILDTLISEEIVSEEEEEDGICLDLLV